MGRLAGAAPLAAWTLGGLWVLLAAAAVPGGAAIGRLVAGVLADPEAMRPLLLGLTVLGATIGAFAALTFDDTAGLGRQLGSTPAGRFARGCAIAAPTIALSVVVAGPPLATLLAAAGAASGIAPATGAALLGWSGASVAVALLAVEKSRRSGAVVNIAGAAVLTVIAAAVASGPLTGLMPGAAERLAAGAGGALIVCAASALVMLAAAAAWLGVLGEPSTREHRVTARRSWPFPRVAGLSAVLGFTVLLVRKSEVRLATGAAGVVGAVTLAAGIGLGLAPVERATYLLLALGTMVLLGTLAPLRAVALAMHGRWLWTAAPGHVVAAGAGAGSAFVAVAPTVFTLAASRVSGTEGVAAGPLVVMAILFWASGLLSGTCSFADRSSSGTDAVGLGLLLVFSGALGAGAGLAVDRFSAVGVGAAPVALGYVGLVSLFAIAVLARLVRRAR